MLFRTQKDVDTSNFVEVLMVSKANKYLTAADLREMRVANRVLMHFPEYGSGLHGLGNGLWFADERLMDEPLPDLKPAVFLVPLEAT